MSQSQDESNPTWELQVSEQARHSETRIIALPDVGRVRVGHSIDHDVVLRELIDSRTSLTLVCQRPHIDIEINEGVVTHHTEQYVSGDTVSLTPDGVLLGPLRLNVAGVKNSTTSDDQTELASNPALLQQNVVKTSPWWQSKMMWGSGIALVASVTMLGWQVNASSGSLLINPQVELEKYLDDQGLNHVTLQTDNNVLVLMGRVSQRSDIVELERFIEDHNFDVVVDVMDGQSTRSQLEDLFRINGVNSSTVFDEAGMLWAKTEEGDLDLLNDLRDVVANDMPALKKWDIANTAPDVPAAPAEPGKQVAMIVSDEPAFVLTVDQTRYFVGSLLPTGHRIAAIESGRVILEKDGDRSEMQF